MLRLKTTIIKGLFLLVCGAMLIFCASCTKSCKNMQSESTVPKLVVGTDANYPPYESVNEEGELEGFDIDIAKHLGLELGKEIEFEQLGLDALILALSQGKVDIIIGGMSITPSKEKKIAMVPYQGELVKEFVLLFYKKIPAGAKKLNFFRKYQDPIAVEAGNVIENYLQKIGFENVKALNGTQDLILDVMNKKSVAGILEPHIADEIIAAKPEFKALKIPLKKEDWVLGNGIGIKKSNKILQEKIKKAVAKLKANGIIEKLEEKWFKGNNK